MATNNKVYFGPDIPNMFISEEKDTKVKVGLLLTCPSTGSRGLAQQYRYSACSETGPKG